MTEEVVDLAETQKYMHELEGLIKAKAKLLRYHKKWNFAPYDIQRDFLDAGVWARERLLRAGNQLGKTETGAFEMACHLTGEYPDDWLGIRYPRPIRAWGAGPGAVLTRDGMQTKLCGKPGSVEDFGTGMIPLKSFKGTPSAGRGATYALDTIFVQHMRPSSLGGVDYTDDGVSNLTFKSFEQGVDKFQSEPVDVIWLDEEAPDDIYTECLTRGNAIADSRIFTTFTPLRGKTKLVIRFMDEPNPHRADFVMTDDDVGHLTPEMKARNIAGYRKHELAARTKGVPMLGSGAIFPYPEESLYSAIIHSIPAHWVKIWGIDFGIDHPFAAALCLWDKDNDIFYVIHTIRVSDQGPLQHAKPMKLVGAAVPVAWPQDGLQREMGSTEPLSKLYKAEKLVMLPNHATWPDGSNSTEAGIMEMQERMETGRFKVYQHLADFWEEYRGYHRKDGLIVKLHDDILSAVRTALMMKRFARAVPLGAKLVTRRGPNDGIARDVDFDLS